MAESEFDNLCAVDDCLDLCAGESHLCERHLERAKKRVIEGFRVYLAARGIRGYLLSDDEVWNRVERIVESMNQHVAAQKQSREMLRDLPSILHLP